MKAGKKEGREGGWMRRRKRGMVGGRGGMIGRQNGSQVERRDDGKVEASKKDERQGLREEIEEGLQRGE